MANLFDEEHKEFIGILNMHQVEYLLVGGMAVNIYGYHRGTSDVDLWVNSTAANKEKLMNAIEAFGYDTNDLQAKNINETLVFSLGERSSFGHIEIMNRIAGLNFDLAYKQVQYINFEGVQLKCIHYNDLIKNKLAAGRFKDLDDVEKLRAIFKNKEPNI